MDSFKLFVVLDRTTGKLLEYLAINLGKVRYSCAVLPTAPEGGFGSDFTVHFDDGSLLTFFGNAQDVYESQNPPTP